MFKLKFRYLLVLLLLCFLPAVPANGLPLYQAAFVIGQPTYTVENDMVYSMNAVPFLENGRSFVPVRYLSMALGVTEDHIHWNADERKVTLQRDNDTIVMSIGDKTIHINGQAQEMDVSPVIRNGYTYLPARYVAEALGYKVTWDENQQAVLIGDGEMPERERVVQMVKKDLSVRLGIWETSITVSTVEAVDWPDTALGCPEPGKMYAEVITPGYKVILSYQNMKYEYHTDKNQILVLCKESKPVIPPAKSG